MMMKRTPFSTSQRDNIQHSSHKPFGTSTKSSFSSSSSSSSSQITARSIQHSKTASSSSSSDLVHRLARKESRIPKPPTLIRSIQRSNGIAGANNLPNSSSVSRIKGSSSKTSLPSSSSSKGSSVSKVNSFNSASKGNSGSKENSFNSASKGNSSNSVSKGNSSNSVSKGNSSVSMSRIKMQPTSTRTSAPGSSQQSSNPRTAINYKSVTVQKTPSSDNQRTGGFSFKPDPNSLKSIMSHGTAESSSSRAVSNFKANYEQRRFTLTASSNAFNNKGNPNNSTAIQNNLSSSLRRLTLNPSSSSTMRNVANIVKDVKSSNAFSGPLRNLLTPKKKTPAVSSLHHTSSSRSFSSSATRRLSISANLASSAAPSSRRQSLFPANTSFMKSFHGDSVNTERKPEAGRRISMFPQSTTRRQSLFPAVSSSNDNHAAVPRIRNRKEEEMKQVDDLLERSKKLLQSVAFTTPRKSAPAPKTDHEKEMAEIEALERQLELEISALEGVSK